MFEFLGRRCVLQYWSFIVRKDRILRLRCGIHEREKLHWAGRTFFNLMHILIMVRHFFNRCEHRLNPTSSFLLIYPSVQQVCVTHLLKVFGRSLIKFRLWSQSGRLKYNYFLDFSNSQLFGDANMLLSGRRIAFLSSCSFLFICQCSIHLPII